MASKPFRLSNTTMSYTKAVKLWQLLHERRRCLMCKTKYQILHKHPNQDRPLSDFLNVDYMVHLQTTHGIEPRDFIAMLYEVVE